MATSPPSKIDHASLYTKATNTTFRCLIGLVIANAVLLLLLGLLFLLNTMSVTQWVLPFIAPINGIIVLVAIVGFMSNRARKSFAASAKLQGQPIVAELQKPYSIIFGLYFWPFVISVALAFLIAFVMTLYLGFNLISLVVT